MCDYTYFGTERNCLKSKLELMRYHLVVAFCIIILAVYSTGCYDKCLKNGEHQKLFQDTVYGASYGVNMKYIVLFSPVYKVV